LFATADGTIDIVTPATGAAQPVPRHREISDNLAKHILKKLAG
jgi:hypothetical protein